MTSSAALLLAAVLAAPVTTVTAAATPGGAERTDKGVRFALPAGFEYSQQLEKEPGEPEDTVYVARKGAVEVRAEVEAGVMSCTRKALAGQPRPGATPAGAPSCELEMPAPPSLDPKLAARRAASVLVQFEGRYLSVVAFAPDQATATGLARQVAASAVAER